MNLTTESGINVHNLRADLIRIFPKALAALEQVKTAQIVEGFLAEAGANAIAIHQFPLYLRSEAAPKYATELAQVEWIYHDLQQPDLVSIKQQALTSENPIYQINPFCRTICLEYDLLEFNLAAGLWCFAPLSSAQVQALSLTQPQAYVLDLMSEGLGFKRESLVQHLTKSDCMDGEGLSQKDAASEIQPLIESGIIQPKF